jgi:hypothetical protein
MRGNVLEASDLIQGQAVLGLQEAVNSARLGKILAFSGKAPAAKGNSKPLFEFSAVEM